MMSRRPWDVLLPESGIAEKEEKHCGVRLSFFLIDILISVRLKGRRRKKRVRSCLKCLKKYTVTLLLI